MLIAVACVVGVAVALFVGSAIVSGLGVGLSEWFGELRYVAKDRSASDVPVWVWMVFAVIVWHLAYNGTDRKVTLSYDDRRLLEASVRETGRIADALHRIASECARRSGTK